MKSSARIVSFALLACLLTAPAFAAETPAVVAPAPEVAQPAMPALPSLPVPESKTPSLLPAAPLSLMPAAQKAAEALSAQKAFRIGYIDPLRINKESEAGKAGLKKIEDRKKKLQTQIETKRKQLDKLKSTIEATLQSLTPPQREAKSKEFQKKVEEFQKFGMGSESELQTLQQEQAVALLGKMEKACNEYGKASGLAMIIIKREQLYLDSSVEAADITDAVIKLINAIN